MLKLSLIMVKHRFYSCIINAIKIGNNSLRVARIYYHRSFRSLCSKFHDFPRFGCWWWSVGVSMDINGLTHMYDITNEGPRLSFIIFPLLSIIFDVFYSLNYIFDNQELFQNCFINDRLLLPDRRYLIYSQPTIYWFSLLLTISVLLFFFKNYKILWRYPLSH